MAATMPKRPILLAAVLLPALMAAGCCHLTGTCLPPIGPALPREEVVRRLEQKSRGIRTVVDTDISLKIRVMTEQDWEQMPTMGGVLVFDSTRPGLWLRAEKLGQLIFNLRAEGDRFWLEFPDTKEVVVGSETAYDQLPNLIRPAEVMLWFGGPEWIGLNWPATTMDVEPEHYRFDVRVGDAPISRAVYVDRRTVSVSRIVELDFLGRPRTVVGMDDYETTGGIEFPQRLTVLRPLYGYWLELALGDTEFNKPIDPAAFRAKERRGWRHIDLDREPISSVQAFNPDR